MDSKLPEAHRLRLLRSVLGAVNLGVVVIDPDGRVVLWNAWIRRKRRRRRATAHGSARRQGEAGTSGCPGRTDG